MQSYGGKNPCIRGWNSTGGSVLANCTAYCIGRALELYGDDAYSLPWQYNAGEYYPKLKESDVWKRSSKPYVGSIACYSRAGEAGHVAFVEQINSDGSIVTSESAWGGSKFYTQTLKPPGYTWSSLYRIQGFIYNTKGPKSSAGKIEELINVAKKSVGRFVTKLIPESTHPTSAEFVLYCAKQVSDVIGTVMVNRVSPSAFVAESVKKNMGSFISGPLFGRVITPKVGDIMMLRTSKTRKYNKDTDCDEVCIITDIEDSYLKIARIAKDERIMLDRIKDSSKTISGYYRPKWSLLDNSADYAVGYAPLGKFYDSENTAEDATIREVAYIGSDNKPTINKSSIKLSVVNYTTLLSSVMDGLLVPSIYSGNISGDVIVDGVQNAKAKECIQFLIGKGLNAAAACGICGNIEAESNFNTAALGDYSGGIPSAFGICQWRFSRATGMKQMAGSDWSNNLTGQLEWLWTELQSGSYKNTVLLPIQAVSNTEQGARQAADIFVRKYEIPADPDGESVKRQKNAVTYFNQVVVQMTTTSKGFSSVIPGNTIISGTSISIPTWVPQATINAIYTNYNYFYNRWGKSTKQYQVSRIWNNKGRKSNRGIATIDGYYLVALKTTFGYSGDKVSIVLDNGTVINCIIADSKGNENAGVSYAAYGHTTAGGKANVVEWEAIGNDTSVYVPQALDLTGWEGHIVSRIVKGGSIL